MLPALSLPHTHTRTHAQMRTVTFYLLSQARILNHISLSLTSFISDIYPHSHPDHPLSEALPISQPPCIQPAHLVTLWVKYECVQWSVVFFWSVAPAMSFVSGLNRKLHSHSEAQAKVHVVGCQSEKNTRQALALSTGTLLDANDSWVQCKAQMGFALSQAAELKRSLTWSCGGMRTAHTCCFFFFPEV